MKIFKQLFIALIVITGLISVNSYAGKDDKVIVCHKTESKNGEHKIVVLMFLRKQQVLIKSFMATRLMF